MHRPDEHESTSLTRHNKKETGPDDPSSKDSAEVLGA